MSSRRSHKVGDSTVELEPNKTKVLFYVEKEVFMDIYPLDD